MRLKAEQFAPTELKDRERNKTQEPLSHQEGSGESHRYLEDHRLHRKRKDGLQPEGKTSRESELGPKDQSILGVLGKEEWKF